MCSSQKMVAFQEITLLKFCHEVGIVWNSEILINKNRFYLQEVGPHPHPHPYPDYTSWSPAGRLPVRCSQPAPSTSSSSAPPHHTEVGAQGADIPLSTSSSSAPPHHTEVGAQDADSPLHLILISTSSSYWGRGTGCWLPRPPHPHQHLLIILR